MADKHPQRAPCAAPELLLKVVLTGTQSHYENRGIIDDKRLEHMLHAGKQILFKSHQESDVRQNLGFSPAVWQGLTSVLSVATPVLEQLCFIYRCPNPATYNNSSSELVAANCFVLVKEIERLNDLCTIARNLLATTKRAQNLAADRGFDQQVLKLIDVCVKVTARGFDGTNVRVEERHQKVCNLFKRLLITCLQFLHNFIMHNEHRKLVLWLDLFGNSQGADSNEAQAEDGSVSEAVSGERDRMDKGLTQASNGSLQAGGLGPNQQTQGSSGTGIPYTIDDVNALFDVMSGQGEPTRRAQDAAKVLMDRIKNDMERLSGLPVDQLDGNPEVMLKVGAALRAQLPAQTAVPRKTANGTTKISTNGRSATLGSVKPTHWSGLPDITSYGNFLSDEEITEADLIMPRTSDSAADTLQEAKDELMARLQDTAPIPEELDDQSYNGDDQGQDVDIEDEIPESVEDSIDDEEDEEEEYHNPDDQERGLLTDVPLVLGPTEIEALPMIIQAGIVDNFGSIKNNSDRQGAKNMQSVRCHILLAQEAGRNVLRELLIFIAAWDLPDDEFYFKMMVQIMESILKNGLMSHAYSDFGQAKDIISPAQAVVIKILTHIFRAKYSPSSGQNNNDQASSRAKIPAPLSRVDVLTVRYIFTVFRGNIIPETCALIYLQGQIRAGLALAEDFPLNLWDMERVYEGVYQFLEFFAVLTENNDWKRLLVEWEIVYDLVTLLKELDASIPKAPLSASMPSPAANADGTAATSLPSQVPPQPKSKAKSGSTVEKPYDALSSTQLPPPPSLPSSTPAPTDPKQSPTNTTLLNTTTPKTKPTSPPQIPRTASPNPPTPSEDPSTFEWRNLKKLIVLVLSSLVWKSTIVQTQIRLRSGVETILSCTQYDGHNPYIKEHAVMCLKFLLEGNEENQGIVRALEARGFAAKNGGNSDDTGTQGQGQQIYEDMGIKARIVDGKVRVSPASNNTTTSSQAQQQQQRGVLGDKSRPNFPLPDRNNNLADKSGGERERERERARRIARRASESNAVAELMGERFARLNLERKEREREKDRLRMKGGGVVGGNNSSGTAANGDRFQEVLSDEEDDEDDTSTAPPAAAVHMEGDDNEEDDDEIEFM